MIFPVALLAAFILFPVTLGSEECHKNDAELLKCQTDLQNERLEKYAQISKCQKDYTDLVKSNLEMQNKYTEVLSQLMDEKVKYAQLHSKQLEVDNLIIQKNKEIHLLKDQNRNLKKTSELSTLTKQFREDIAKLGKIVKMGGSDKHSPTESNNKTTNVEVEDEEVPTTPLPNNSTTPLPNINNQTTSKTETIDFPDPCPRKQNGDVVLREIQLPGSDPFTVACGAYSDIGYGWLHVYRKHFYLRSSNRAYADYERGFGDLKDQYEMEYHIGLNRLHYFTSGNPFEVIIWTTWAIKKCTNFVVGDQSEGYKVKSISNCTGIDAWMTPKQGYKFSSFDRDEDGVPDRNLAEEMHFGWWFDPGMRPDNDIIYVYIRRTDCE
nr:tenascin-R-like isoform X2 [Drosophila bipectinata]